jgi:hypothetical protein
MPRKIANADKLFAAKKLYLEVHLTEFSRLREETLFYQSQKATAANFSFLALAGMLTILPDLLENTGDYILLISTLPFFGITWYAMSMENMISNLSSYLKTNLIPKINNLLMDQEVNEADISKDILNVLEWEQHSTSSRVKNLRLTLSDGIFNTGRAVILFGPILVLIVIFVLRTKILNPRTWTDLEGNLLWANVIGLILIGVLGLMVRSKLGK